MKRRDYITVACAMQRSRPHQRDLNYADHYRQWYLCCLTLSEELARDNRAFNEELFIDNCLSQEPLQ